MKPKQDDNLTIRHGGDNYATPTLSFSELPAAQGGNACFRASWGFGDGPGCLFETYGDELDFVLSQDPQTVWTFVDGDDGDQYVMSGFHIVNRIGYLLSIEPVPEGTDIEVHIPAQDDPTAETDE